MRGIRETFMTTLNLGNLATFRLVVQRGSFSAAADALGISQPAVSLQVRQLEQFLQTRLLERTGRGIKATAAGMALLAHSEQIDRVVNSAVQSVSAFSQEVNGSLTLAPRLYRQLAVVMRQDKIVTKGIAEMLRLLHTVRL